MVKGDLSDDEEVLNDIHQVTVKRASLQKHQDMVNDEEPDKGNAGIYPKAVRDIVREGPEKNGHYFSNLCRAQGFNNLHAHGRHIPSCELTKRFKQYLRSDIHQVAVKRASLQKQQAIFAKHCE